MDNDLIPVMADRPSFNQMQGVFAETTPNSRNHDAKGQNVLYLGGAVRFVTTPRIALMATTFTSTNKTASPPACIAWTPCWERAISSHVRCRGSERRGALFFSQSRSLQVSSI